MSASTDFIRATTHDPVGELAAVPHDVYSHVRVTGEGVSTPTSRRSRRDHPSFETDEDQVGVRFASTKILVQTQWEAVRFDRVKHTADTLRAVFSAGPSDSLEQQRRGARAPGAIGLSGATTLRAAAD